MGSIRLITGLKKKYKAVNKGNIIDYLLHKFKTNYGNYCHVLNNIILPDKFIAIKLNDNILKKCEQSASKANV